MSLDAPHILVVDDDTRLRELLHKYLTEQGFDVSTAEDGRRAISRLEEEPIDLDVLDARVKKFKRANEELLK